VRNHVGAHRINARYERRIRIRRPPCAASRDNGIVVLREEHGLSIVAALDHVQRLIGKSIERAAPSRKLFE